MRQSGGAYDEARLMEYFRRAEQADLRRMIASEIAAAGGEKEFAEALRRQGRSRDAWETEIRKELFRRYLLGRELGRISVSPTAVETFYDENRELFRRPTLWRLRRIVIPKKGYGSPAEARQAADFVLQRLRDGADFAVIAQTLAADPPFDKDGGRLCRAGRLEVQTGEFPFEEKAAKTLSDGAFSSVLDHGEWFVIVLREGCEPGGIPPLEKVRPYAEKLALDDLVRRRKAEFYGKLKGDAFVEILCPEPPE
jgi:parvulin-like peptidyl-prolyl isomerase